MKRVSVVILNWNGVDMLRKFIPSVMDNSVGEGIEICVADNASSDGSLEMLRSEFPVVRLIELDQNYGFAEGYNRALEQVDAEYVVLLNSDVEVTPHWLEPLLDYMDTHSGTVACQPKLLSWHNIDLVGMILDWLNTGMKKDPEGLIRRVGEIFHGNIEAALTRVSR